MDIWLLLPSINSRLVELRKSAEDKGQTCFCMLPDLFRRRVRFLTCVHRDSEEAGLKVENI